MRDSCDAIEPLHSAWVDRALPPPEAARVAAHVDECPACAQAVDALAHTRALLANLPPRQPPAALFAAIEQPRGVGPSSSRRLARRAAAGLAVAAGLVGGAAFSLGAQPEPDSRTVAVPVDLFVADHLAHSVGGPVHTPVVLHQGR